ncbi:MAG: hypothetical protein WC574_05020 [Candidatus Omnitrophota bacterium]
MKLFKPKKILQKRFIAAEFDTLVIETIQTVAKQGLSPKGTVPVSHLRILKLKGTWRANEYNELVFEVTGRKGPPQTYTFKGAWKLNKNQQIEYLSEDGSDRLIFRGYWQLASKDKLVYVFEGSSVSRFEFKAQFESPALYPKKGQIRFRLGAGIRQNRLNKGRRLIILYGEWKFGRNLGLSFNMNYGQGRVKSIDLGAEVTFDRSKVMLALNNELGEPLGVTITMTRKFLEHLDAEAFVRLKARGKEQGVEAGFSIPF